MTSLAKIQWKITHRLLRIARREGMLAYSDVLNYGLGGVLIKPTGEVKYINPRKMPNDPNRNL